ncbi:caspase family protein [Sphaerochaeta sp.]|uniref:caspase family protein n=1 Tax=Sphaerochaeta sp. TaxID=1972642 RepID=UPI003D1303AA
MSRHLPKLILLLLIPTLVFSSCELFWEKPMEGDVYAIMVALDYENSSQSDLAGTIPDAEELFFALTAVTSKADRAFHGYKFLQEDKDIYSSSTTHDIGGTPISDYPSITNIENAIAQLATITKDEDLILFTYSGHGGADGTIALAPMNSGDTAYTYLTTTLLTRLSAVKGKKLVILDSCYSGIPIPESSSSLSLVYENSINDWFNQYWSSEDYTIPDIFLLTAAADTESWEISVAGHKHGDFTLTLLEGLGWPDPHPTISANPTTVDAVSQPRALKGSVLTVDSLYSYIKDHQTYPIRSTLFWPRTNVQHPMTNGGAMDMILFRF